jgi:ADP-ribose pyrophosphatase YjhB (NUDIX family)
MEKIIYCADTIAKYKGKFVLVKRLNYPQGLALVGGKFDEGEPLWNTAVREFEEETGLKLEITSVLKTYAEENRDQRGNYISTVFVGNATGILRDETGKTKVTLLTKEEIFSNEKNFAFDHFKILKDYFNIFN